MQFQTETKEQSNVLSIDVVYQRYRHGLITITREQINSWQKPLQTIQVDHNSMIHGAQVLVSSFQWFGSWTHHNP
jgi:hypothetical protein